VGEIITAVVLAPVALGIGVVWSIQKLPKARWMLLIAIPCTLLWIAGVFGFVYWMPGTMYSKKKITPKPRPSLQYSDPNNPFSQPPQPGRTPDDSGNSPTDTAPTITRPPDESDLAQQPAEIQRALRANVRLVIAGTQFLGSGIVVRQENSSATILTNRHVVDSVFYSSHGAIGTSQSELSPIEVTYVTAATERGKVIWLAPNDVDLALVRAVCPTTGVEVADWELTTPVIQGEPVFAVGNPAGLGWSMTRGTVSALRKHEVRAQQLPLIQTDAAINPGNSGGGLYNAGGKLIGINNFIVNPGVAQNVGFAIRFSYLAELKPDFLQP